MSGTRQRGKLLSGEVGAAISILNNPVMNNILVVDDHPLMRFGLQLQIKETFPDYTVHLAASYDEALASLAASASPVELIVLDIVIPKGQGIHMVEELKTKYPNTKILIFTSKDEEFNAPLYLQAGADGFLSKMAQQEEFTKALTVVLRGNRYLSMRMQEFYLFESGALRKYQESEYDLLSNREKQILYYILEGRQIKEISYLVDLKQSTVSSFKDRILRKMRVSNTIELVNKMNSIYNRGIF